MGNTDNNSTGVGKIILTVALFIVVGFIFSLVINSVESNSSNSNTSVDAEILKTVTNTANMVNNLDKRIANLEDNLTKSRNANIITSNTNK